MATLREIIDAMYLNKPANWKHSTAKEIFKKSTDVNKYILEHIRDEAKRAITYLHQETYEEEISELIHIQNVSYMQLTVHECQESKDIETNLSTCTNCLNLYLAFEKKIRDIMSGINRTSRSNCHDFVIQQHPTCSALIIHQMENETPKQQISKRIL